MHGTSFMLNSDNKDKIAQSSFTHTSLKGHKIMIGSCVKLYQASSGIYPEFKTGFHSGIRFCFLSHIIKSNSDAQN